MTPIAGPSHEGPPLQRYIVAPCRRHSALPDMPLVSFLDNTEGDVCEQGREDPALRRAGITAEKGSLRQDAGLQERHDQPVHLGVANPSANQIHQAMMADVVEASLDISLHDPLVREP